MENFNTTGLKNPNLINKMYDLLYNGSDEQLAKAAEILDIEKSEKAFLKLINRAISVLIGNDADQQKREIYYEVKLHNQNSILIFLYIEKSDKS